MTVTFPRFDATRSLQDWAATVRTAVNSEFKQSPDDIVLGFSLGSTTKLKSGGQNSRGVINAADISCGSSGGLGVAHAVGDAPSGGRTPWCAPGRGPSSVPDAAVGLLSVQDTPRKPRSPASARPTGPAPTMGTGVRAGLGIEIVTVEAAYLSVRWALVESSQTCDDLMRDTQRQAMRIRVLPGTLHESVLRGRHYYSKNSLSFISRDPNELAPPLPQDVQLIRIMLEQVSRHFRLCELIADALRGDIAEKTTRS